MLIFCFFTKKFHSVRIALVCSVKIDKCNTNKTNVDNL